MTTNAFNVNIYYNEEEVHSAFQHYFNDVKLNSVVHVFSKNSAPFEKYMHEENVLMYDSGNFFDKVRNWLAGETQFEDQFAHLNITDVDRKKFNKIINNGGTIVISNAAFNTSSTYKPDLIANRDMFKEDFDYPSAAAVNTLNPVQPDALQTNRVSYPTQSDEQKVAFAPIELDESSQIDSASISVNQDDFATPANRESFPYPVNAADQKSDKTYGLQYNSERKDFGMPEDAPPENLKFNPVQQPERKHVEQPFTPTQTTTSNFDPLTDTNKDSFNTNPDGITTDFQPIQQDLASQESLTTDDILTTDTNFETNKQSFPYESRAAEVPNDTNSYGDEHALKSFAELEHLTEEEQRFFDESPAVNENYDLQFNDEPSSSVGVNYEHYSQNLSPTDTINTFDAISSRNHPADYEAELAQKEETHSLNPFTYTEDGSFTEQLPVDDALHRVDGLEDEETFTAFLDDENPTTLRDDTLGKASEFRRHDLP